MRKTTAAIFVISTLVVLVLCSACVLFPSGEQKTQQGGGPVQVTVPRESSRISFEVAYKKLKEYPTDLLNGPVNNITIYYIFAKDVDTSGDAESWVFGVNYGMGLRVLIYEKIGWTEFPLSNTTLPSEEIVIDQIVSPSDLFTKNKAIIMSTSSSSTPELIDLELQHGIYTLTLNSGDKGRVIRFDATTGKVIA